MNLKVNGNETTINGNATVVGLLKHLSRDPEQPGVAVAVNDHVVRRVEWESHMLEEDDRIEIITASQGG